MATRAENLALRVALTAAHLLGLATGSFLRNLRGHNDPLAEALAQLKEADLRLPQQLPGQGQGDVLSVRRRGHDSR